MKKLAWSLTATFVYNTAIAVVLTAIEWLSKSSNFGFWCNFTFSQSIGFSIAIISALTLSRMSPGRLRWAALSLVLPLSVAVGMSIGFKLTGTGSWSHPDLLPLMVIGLFFGVIASITFVLVERIEKLNLEVQQRQRRQSESEKREIEAHLKLLQAQIEPHFLFNTLANVVSLIETQPTLAKTLLERLDDWLRMVLLRSRGEHTTLHDELELLENYLQILAIRFGTRLRWHILASDEIRALQFPPMLLQPLVENAVRHGIEPKIGGGELGISAEIKNSQLHIVVSDDGVGLSHVHSHGNGLENVRARLAALYGDKASVNLASNDHGGVTATLELPL